LKTISQIRQRRRELVAFVEAPEFVIVSADDGQAVMNQNKEAMDRPVGNPRLHGPKRLKPTTSVRRDLLITFAAVLTAVGAY
jgi:hypothetical protein